MEFKRYHVIIFQAVTRMITGATMAAAMLALMIAMS